MGQLQIRVFKQILERMQNKVVARTNLTDILKTGTVRQVLAAAAREDDDQYYQMGKLLDLFDVGKARGPDLDERAKELNPNKISRRLSQYATTQVRFSRQGTTGDVTIPVGTEVNVPGTNFSYTTTQEAIILDTFQDSSLADVVANEKGADYNTDPGTITGFGSKPVGVDTVTNPAAATNGADVESDDAFRQRIDGYLASLPRGTVRAVAFAALTAEDAATGKRALFANIIEDDVNLGNVTVYIDDGAGTAETTAVGAPPDEVLTASAVGGEIDFYSTNKPIKIESTFTLERDDGGGYAALTKDVDYTVNPASGHIKLTQASFPSGLVAGDKLKISAYTYFDGLIAEAQKIVDGDPNDRSTYPGYRAAGVLVRVLAPDVQQQIVTANITVRQGFSQVGTATLVKAAINFYINSLGIGEPVIYSEIVERCMAIRGMFDITITAPAENVVIGDTQLARVLDANISIA